MTHAVLLKEVRDGETRVAATPDTLSKFAKLGLQVRVQAGAGVASGFPDDAYREAGAEVLEAIDLGAADLVLKVAPPTVEEIGGLKRGATLVSLVQASLHQDEARALTDAGVTTLALLLI